jgi:uncharacterized protein (TIGR02246 family)
MPHSHVQALQDTFSLGLLVGDADLCASVYAPDAWFVSREGELVRGRPAITQAWQQIMDRGGRGNATVTEDLEVRGDLLIERGVYAHFAQPVGLGRPLERGRFTIVHQRQPDGRWLWSHDVLMQTAVRP